MSESLPYSGVAIVLVMRNAVVAQACSDSPPRSSAMVRMAVDTTVWSSAARNMPSSSPTRIVRIGGGLSSPDGGELTRCGVALVIGSLLLRAAHPRAVFLHPV